MATRSPSAGSLKWRISPILRRKFREKATALKRLVQERLWTSKPGSSKVLPRSADARLADVRELHGYTPWHFNLPDAEYSIAWKQIMDPGAFSLRMGLTTAEQCHARFTLSYQGHECQWNGPSWPYATSVTLTAMANLLNNYRQKLCQRERLFRALKIYAGSHQLKKEDGAVVPWIDENLNPLTAIGFPGRA